MNTRPSLAPDMLIVDALHPLRRLITVRRIDLDMRKAERSFTPNAEFDAAFDEGARWADDGAIVFPAPFAGNADVDAALDAGARWSDDGAIEFRHLFENGGIILFDEVDA